jgi:hypothetical protein
MNTVELEDAITSFAIDLIDEGLSFAEVMREIKATFDGYDRKRIAEIIRSL